MIPITIGEMPKKGAVLSEIKAKLGVVTLDEFLDPKNDLFKLDFVIPQEERNDPIWRHVDKLLGHHDPLRRITGVLIAAYISKEVLTALISKGILTGLLSAFKLVSRATINGYEYKNLIALLHSKGVLFQHRAPSIEYGLAGVYEIRLEPFRSHIIARVGEESLKLQTDLAIEAYDSKFLSSSTQLASWVTSQVPTCDDVNESDNVDEVDDVSVFENASADADDARGEESSALDGSSPEIGISDCIAHFIHTLHNNWKTVKPGAAADTLFDEIMKLPGDRQKNIHSARANAQQKVRERFDADHETLFNKWDAAVRVASEKAYLDAYVPRIGGIPPEQLLKRHERLIFRDNGFWALHARKLYPVQKDYSKTNSPLCYLSSKGISESDLAILMRLQIQLHGQMDSFDWEREVNEARAGVYRNWA